MKISRPIQKALAAGLLAWPLLAFNVQALARKVPVQELGIAFGGPGQRAGQRRRKITGVGDRLGKVVEIDELAARISALEAKK